MLKKWSSVHTRQYTRVLTTRPAHTGPHTGTPARANAPNRCGCACGPACRRPSDTNRPSRPRVPGRDTGSGPSSPRRADKTPPGAGREPCGPPPRSPRAPSAGPTATTFPSAGVAQAGPASGEGGASLPPMWRIGRYGTHRLREGKNRWEREGTRYECGW